MRTMRTIRHHRAARAAAQALFFMALLGAFLLGMFSTKPTSAGIRTLGNSPNPATWTPSAEAMPPLLGPLTPGASPVQAGASMRGVMEALPIQ